MSLGVSRFPEIVVLLELLLGSEPWRLRLQRNDFGFSGGVVVLHPLEIASIPDNAMTINIPTDPTSSPITG
jgi:hypothetical protein